MLSLDSFLLCVCLYITDFWFVMSHIIKFIIAQVQMDFNKLVFYPPTTFIVFNIIFNIFSMYTLAEYCGYIFDWLLSSFNLLTNLYGLPLWLNGKESTCHAGATGNMHLFLGLGRRYTGGGHGNPLQVFLPGESHGQRSLVIYSPQSWTRLKQLSTHAHTS